jgi:malonate-semialdehyde dehydrogenase (acetylating)/methylmalonate-semialdehyde dehydrogenase
MPAIEAPIQVRTVSHWIGGRLTESSSGKSGVVWDPATGEQQASVAFASVAEVDAAVATAKAAFPAWRATALSRRAEILFKMRELFDQNRRRIAEPPNMARPLPTPWVKWRAESRMSSSPAVSLTY